MENKINLIELRSDQKKYFDLWNSFVENDSNNGTIFHRLDFLSYHGDRFEGNENHLLFLKKETVLGVLPLGLFDEDDEKIARSPFGASFGGLVIRKHVSLADIDQMVSSLIAYLSSQGVASLRMVCPPKIYERTPDDGVDFFMLKNGAVPHKMDLTSYIDLRQDPTGNFLSAAKRNIATAQKAGLHFYRSEDVGAFYDIIEKNRMEKFGVKPTHSQQEVQWLIKEFPDRFKIFLISYGDEVVASLMSIICNQKTMYAFCWAHKERFQHLRPINFLFHKLIEFAQENGFSYLDLGPQTHKMEPFYGVVKLKESLGGRGMLRNSYRLDLGQALSDRT